MIGPKLVELVTRRGALAELERARPPRERQRAALARSALARARRVLSSVDPDEPSGDVFELFGACRDAIYWALTIKDFETPQTIAGAWQRADPALLNAAAGVPGAQAWQSLLVEDGHLELAGDRPEAWALGEDALAFATKLVARCDPEGELELRLERQRAVRLAAVLAGVLAGLGCGWWLARAPDLARGKQWRASSAYGGYLTSGTDQQKSDVGVFFHTVEEASPWVEVDLGSDVPISEVTVVNRGDTDPAVAARAVPLVIEVRSTDSTAWTEVARRELAFATWSASFPGIKARVVRVRALRNTWLHLERIELR